MGKEKRYTALLFGSFDPVHVGHLIIAEHFLNLDEVDEVWFVITPHNPLKSHQKQTEAHVRQTMLELAVENIPGFRVSDIEFDMPSPHYTYKTLLRLYHVYPARNFILLIGGDNLCDFDKWKNYQEILALVPVYVYPRPGFDAGAITHPPGIIKTDAPLVGISSSEIRKNLAAGKATRFMLPGRVYDFIRQKGIYSNPNSFLTTST
jgi:nicotinate-nucleotide adenylyltransferase